MNAWDHMPDVNYISWAIYSIKKYPRTWIAACKDAAAVVPSNVLEATRKASWNIVNNIALREQLTKNPGVREPLSALLSEMWVLEDDFSLYAKLGIQSAKLVFLTLAAYDDCAYMIESDVDSIKILAALGAQKAILLLPACIVFNETKEIG